MKITAISWNNQVRYQPKARTINVITIEPDNDGRRSVALPDNEEIKSITGIGQIKIMSRQVHDFFDSRLGLGALIRTLQSRMGSQPFSFFIRLDDPPVFTVEKTDSSSRRRVQIEVDEKRRNLNRMRPQVAQPD